MPTARLVLEQQARPEGMGRPSGQLRIIFVAMDELLDAIAITDSPSTPCAAQVFSCRLVRVGLREVTIDSDSDIDIMVEIDPDARITVLRLCRTQGIHLQSF